jgi:hypothetical protein
MIFWLIKHHFCRNPTLREVWSCHSHSRKGDLGVLRDPENLERNYRGQNTLHWSVLYIIGKVLKCRCPKWLRTSHLDIYNTSYGWKKGRESNCQFDSRPLKVKNRPDPDVCKWSATYRWKVLKDSYKFVLNLFPIGGQSEKLWMPKVPRVQTRTVSGFHLWSPGKKCYSDASATKRHIKYYMGEGGGFPQVRAVVSQMSPELPVAYPSTKSAPECELANLLIAWMQVRVSE